jgi:hypothetical protein
VTSNRVPGGVALAPDEATLIDDRFMYSTVVFYLHTELALTNRRFLAARPSTILGLIPVGTSRSSYPIDNIAGVNAGTRFDVLGVIFGVVALLAGLAALAVPNARSLGIVLILLGVGMIAGAPKQYVEIMNSGGGAIRFPVSVSSAVERLSSRVACRRRSLDPRKARAQPETSRDQRPRATLRGHSTSSSSCEARV